MTSLFINDLHTHTERERERERHTHTDRRSLQICILYFDESDLREEMTFYGSNITDW